MIEFSHGPVLWQTIASVAIALVVYICLMTDAWNRTIVVWSGVCLMLIAGIVPVREAFTTYMNWTTILLIFVISVLSSLLQKTGLIEFAAMRLIQRTNVKPMTMMMLLAALAAAGSALLDGVMMVAALVPFTITVSRILKLTAIPFLIGEIMAANIGGAATMIGNIPNRLISGAASISYWQFLMNLAPLMLLLLILLLFALHLMYGKHFIISEAQRSELLSKQVVINVDYKSMLRIVRKKPYASLLQEIADSHIIFFTGLFVLVGGLIHAGVAGYISARALELTQGNTTYLNLLIMWITGLSSATMDQIPYVAAMLPTIQEAGAGLGWTLPGQLQPLWWSLAIGAGVGGGATLMGSYLNMVAAGLAAKEKIHIHYWQYFQFAFPLTMLFLVVSTLYMLLFVLLLATID